MTDRSNEVSPVNGLAYETAAVETAEEIKRLLKGAPPVIRGMTAHLAKATGKMIRARVLLGCALKADGTVNPDAVKAAAAAELLHLATLVHDDIIDDADKRRGISTLHRKFGEKYAVLCGDYLFCAALELVSTVSTLENAKDMPDRSFPRYLTEVCLGELRQNQNDFNYALSEREYFKIIRGKTAALFEACFYVGFLFSGEADAARELYTEAGNNIGIIFQLNDDCADYASTRRQSRKPVLSDYGRGVITLPLIYAMKKDKSLREQAGEGMEPAKLKAAVQAAGGLAYTYAKIESLYKKTGKIIDAMEIGGAKKELLTQLLQKSAGRVL